MDMVQTEKCILLTVKKNGLKFEGTSDIMTKCFQYLTKDASLSPELD